MAFRRLGFFTTGTMRNDFRNHGQLVLIPLCRGTINISVAIILASGVTTERSFQSLEVVGFPGFSLE